MTANPRLAEAYEDMTEIARLKRRIAKLEAALEPFSEMAGEMFARGWHLGRLVVALDNPGDPHRIYYDDFVVARRTLKGGKDE